MASSGKKSVFLDVDSSIVENNLRITNNEEEDFQKLLGNIPGPSKVIKPSPGICVKTKEIGTENKVFVNVCQTDAIPAPKDISEKELNEILDSEEICDYKVPMSIGEIRTEKDKTGVDVKVVDIAINPKFFKKIDEFISFKSFFMAVAFEGISHKYGINCVDEKIILKNKKAFGTLQTHRIQQREVEDKMGVKSNSLETKSTSLIKEVTGQKEEKKKVVIETLSSNDNPVREPEYRLYKKKGGQNCLIGEFKLPDIIYPKELTLDIGEDRILLESKAKGYLLDIFIPYVVRQESCDSTFNTASKVLTVTMPLVGG